MSSSVSSLETFRQLMIYPLPDDDVELNIIAQNQVKYFLRKKRRKSEIFKAKREMDKETADHWLKKHSGKPRLCELTTEELQTFFQWFTTTIDTFRSENGLIQPRKLLHYLHSLRIFEEFSYAFHGCGMKHITQFREFIASQLKKKDGHYRQRQKMPLHMTSLNPTSPYTKDSNSQLKKNTLTTKLPLAGGGVMYMCCPDGTGYTAPRRPNTAPAPAAATAPMPPPKKPLVRQKAHKTLLLHSPKSTSNLFSALSLPNKPNNSRKKGALLMASNSLGNGSGRPEVDDEAVLSTASAIRSHLNETPLQQLRRIKSINTIYPDKFI